MLRCGHGLLPVRDWPKHKGGRPVTDRAPAFLCMLGAIVPIKYHQIVNIIATDDILGAGQSLAATCLKFKRADP